MSAIDRNNSSNVLPYGEMTLIMAVGSIETTIYMYLPVEDNSVVPEHFVT